MIDSISPLSPRATGTGPVGAPRITPQQAPGAQGNPSFAEVFQDVAQDTVHALRNAEATSIRAMHDEASTREAVETIITAEQKFHTATAIRDKVVEAYKTISRMAI